MVAQVKIEELPAFLGRKDMGLPLQGRLVHGGGAYSVPFLFLRRTLDPVLFTFFNGAVDRVIRPDGVVFQRSTWAADMKGSLLYLSDPSILENSGMSLGWGQTPLNEKYFPRLAADISRYLAVLLEIQNRVYVGSSAGGYQAAAASIYDSEAWAWVNNAQFDWTRYESSAAVDRVTKMLGFSSVQELSSEAGWRTSIPKLAEHERIRPRICYHLNLESPVDVHRQLPVFKEISGEVELHTYHDKESGHNPLTRSEWSNKLLDFAFGK